MEQEIIAKIEFTFFIIIALSELVILIFCLRRKEDRNLIGMSLEE